MWTGMVPRSMKRRPCILHKPVAWIILWEISWIPSFLQKRTRGAARGGDYGRCFGSRGQCSNTFFAFSDVAEGFFEMQ